jgi:acetyl esterase/lipase
VLRTRWSALRPLFEAALDLPAADWPAWLAQATDDPVLREALRELHRLKAEGVSTENYPISQQCH